MSSPANFPPGYHQQKLEGFPQIRSNTKFALNKTYETLRRIQSIRFFSDRSHHRLTLQPCATCDHTIDTYYPLFLQLFEISPTLKGDFLDFIRLMRVSLRGSKEIDFFGIFGVMLTRSQTDSQYVILALASKPSTEFWGKPTFVRR